MLDVISSEVSYQVILYLFNVNR